MQKSKAIYLPVFNRLMIPQLRWPVAGLFLAFGLTHPLIAQVVPAPTTTQPTTGPTTGNPTGQPGQFNPTTGQPIRTNPATTPPAGRTNATNPANTGRTVAPTNTPGRVGPTFERSANEDAVNDIQADEALNQEQQLEAARNREKLTLRRKLFGSALFSNPDNAGTFQPNLRIATPANYNIGPDDQLKIRLYGFSEADYSQSVSPEGYIYVAGGSGIGPIMVAGLTIEQARDRIADRLAQKFIGLKNSQYGAKNTFLELSLGNIRTIKVTAVGDAVKPGSYALSSLSTVMNAVYQAGGPNELGSFRNISVIRNNRIVTTIDLYDYLLTGILRSNPRLQDNDVIRFNTYKTRVEILGPTKRNNIFELLPTENLDKLLYYAGGFAATAYKNKVQVTRLTDKELRVIDVPAADFSSFALQDGDKVSVNLLLDRYENQITLEGAVFRPGPYSLNQSPTLKTLIANADGLKGDAFIGRVYIIRTREDLVLETLSFNLGDILNGIEPDVLLKREDVVRIPSKFDLAEQATVSITGDVNNPSGTATTYPFSANMTIEDLILRAGGLKESAATSQIEVIRRRKDVDPTSAKAQLSEIIRLNINRDLSLTSSSTGFVLHPFDEVIVRRSPSYFVQSFVTIDGQVVLPGRYAIRSKDQKISDLIAEAGGLTQQAYVPGATLIRRVRLTPDEIAAQQKAVSELADDTRKGVVEVEAVTPDKPEAIGINLGRILKDPGSVEDILIQEGDLLRIPKLLETVRMQGEVLLPTTVKFRAGQTFQDYISQSGGFTTRSLRRSAYVVYANGSVDRTRRFMFFNIYPRIEPGSEVVVPRRTAPPLTPAQALSQATAITGALISFITTIVSLVVVTRLK